MVRRAGGPARVRVVAVVGAIALLLTVCLSAEAAITDKLVSRTSNGVPADGDSSVDASTAISHDGVVVAFDSKAANLPGGDGTTDQVYARNLETGKTKLVSRKSNGDPAGGPVFGPGISADGRFVAFFGLGNGLPGANGVVQQAWIADRKTHRVRLVSKANNGAPGDSPSNYPSVSADGRYVVFASYSSNLPGGDGVHGVADLQLFVVRQHDPPAHLRRAPTHAQGG